MEDLSADRPYTDIIPVLIRLCANSASNDRAGHKAHINALFSMLTSSAKARPTITTHWLLDVHRELPEKRPAMVLNLMARSLRNDTKRNPEQGMILSAQILNQTEEGSELSEIASNAFCRAFDAALRKDRLAARVPIIAHDATEAVCDDRIKVLKAHIRQGVMQAHIKLHA